METGAGAICAVVRHLEDGFALVEVKQGGCGRCHEEGGCGGQSLTQMFSAAPRLWRVANTISAQPGDSVIVSISPGSVRRVANLAYGLPLLTVIGGAATGSWLSGDLGAIIGAAAGLLLAVVYVRWQTRRAIENPANQPHIISRS